MDNTLSRPAADDQASHSIDSTQSPPGDANAKASNTSQTASKPLADAARSKQGVFNTEQKAFLTQYFAAYRTKCHELDQIATGPRRTRNVMGDKGQWVMDNVYKKFVEKFNSDGPDGPNLESLQHKMKKWYSNQFTSNKANDTAVSSSTEKPRATTGIEVFAQENKTNIHAKITEERTQLGQSPKEANLPLHRKLKKELFEELDEDARAEYEAKAAELNARRDQPPDPKLVFGNQDSLIATTSSTLRKMCGWEWGGHGDVVFFVQAAYRDEEGHLKSFNVTVSKEAKSASFSETYTDIKNFRKHFKQFAHELLPAPRVKEMTPRSPHQEPNLVIAYNEDGYPLLPSVDPESIPVAACRQLLTKYIEFAWGLSSSAAVPSDILGSPLRDSVGLVSHNDLATFPSLDLKVMKGTDVLRLYTTIFDAQNKFEFIIKFAKPAHVTSPDDDEISEVLNDGPSREASPVTDAPKPPSPSPPTMDFTPQILRPSASCSATIEDTAVVALTEVVPGQGSSGGADPAPPSSGQGRDRGCGRGRGRGQGHGRGRGGGKHAGGRNRDTTVKISASTISTNSLVGVPGVEAGSVQSSVPVSAPVPASTSSLISIPVAAPTAAQAQVPSTAASVHANKATSPALDNAPAVTPTDGPVHGRSPAATTDAVTSTTKRSPTTSTAKTGGIGSSTTVASTQGSGAPSTAPEDPPSNTSEVRRSTRKRKAPGAEEDQKAAPATKRWAPDRWAWDK
ncbi:hypothetical protein Hypma_007049 [Hypsizygus marmoreus]|uniref:Uncharacterized protein n=1 Tax=Hypsizygus marmoreus TaxID=39966 RepID=A0A369KFI0_HYPMA|nr:hypothetical protein Hypma_007049 [Hypsizygus marmoreus]